MDLHLNPSIHTSTGVLGLFDRHHVETLRRSDPKTERPTVGTVGRGQKGVTHEKSQPPHPAVVG